MAKSLTGSGCREVRDGGVQERAARGGEQQPGHASLALANEALPDRRVLRIYGAKPAERRGKRVAWISRSAGRPHGQAASQRHHQVAARDQRLFVRRGDDLACGQRSQNRPEGDHATGRHQHEIHVRAGGECLQGIGAGLDPRTRRQIQARGLPAVGDRHDRRAEEARLLLEKPCLRAGCQRDHPEGIGPASDDVDRLAADRSAGAEQRYPERPRTAGWRGAAPLPCGLGAALSG